MSWLLYLFGGGLALFVGAALVLLAAGLFVRVVGGWRASALTILALVGLVVVVLSAAPLSYWVYSLAISMTIAWLWSERTGIARLRDWKASLRWATVAIWAGVMLLELPHQMVPRLVPDGNPPLWIIGDSVTAGMGSGTTHVWPELLPASVEVHNLAQPGATARSALKQADKLPADGGLILLEIGGNDLLGETSAAQFERDLDELLARVCGSAGASPSQTAPTQASSSRQVLMFELPLPPLCNEYGRVQRRLAARYGVRLIPKRVFISVIAVHGGTLDSIHLSDAGHERMAAAVWSIVRPAYSPAN